MAYSKGKQLVPLHKYRPAMKNTLTAMLLATASILVIEARTPKAVYIIVDGVPADQIERLHTPAIFDIAAEGVYGRAYTGGEIGSYSETPTISAIGYTNLLTATWLNKHNVGGNENLKPNYNYWTIFRIAKEQTPPATTGLYSSWTDNRTVLIGQGKPETGNLKIDFVADGYDLDTIAYPHRQNDLHVFDYDQRVAAEAAASIRRDAPDLSWVYLWYTDDAGHIKGNGEYFDNYLRQADDQVAAIWEAVKYRRQNFDEDWMIIVTTDHGRTENGHGHGGQSQRERTTWVATNKPVNAHFHDGTLAIVDIAPTLCRHLGFEVPQNILWEQDGIPFTGPADIHSLRTAPYDNTVTLQWSTHTPVPVSIYAATTNNFKTGGTDQYIKIADLPAGTTSHTLDLTALPSSKFYKFVVTSPSTHLTRWLIK